MLLNVAFPLITFCVLLLNKWSDFYFNYLWCELKCLWSNGFLLNGWKASHYTRARTRVCVCVCVCVWHSEVVVYTVYKKSPFPAVFHHTFWVYFTALLFPRRWFLFFESSNASRCSCCAWRMNYDLFSNLYTCHF